MKNPLSSDAEIRIDSKRRDVANPHRIDMGGNRSSFDRDKEFGNGARIPFGFAFHLSVPVVADPAGQPQPFGAIDREGAKPHTLDLAGNEEMHAAAVALAACGCNFGFHVEEI